MSNAAKCSGFLAGLVLTFGLAEGAQASTVTLDLTGPGVSGSLLLTYGSATDARYPAAYEVTGISGTFSDANNGLAIVDAPVGDLVPITHATPQSDNLLAPYDFSRFAVAAGLPADNHGFLTFDNLYYPGGSPQTASDYPVHGGVLDIYGLLFGIGGDRVVDLFSFGAGPDGIASYGVGVASPAMSLDYVGGVTVAAIPEPDSRWLLAGGLLGLLAYRRRASTTSRG